MERSVASFLVWHRQQNGRVLQGRLSLTEGEGEGEGRVQRISGVSR